MHQCIPLSLYDRTFGKKEKEKLILDMIKLNKHVEVKADVIHSVVNYKHWFLGQSFFETFQYCDEGKNSYASSIIE